MTPAHVYNTHACVYVWYAWRGGGALAGIDTRNATSYGGLHGKIFTTETEE